MKNDYMNISVVRISLFVSNNYNMVVIYQPYTSIKYARYITILNTVDIDSTNPNPKRLRIRQGSSWKSESYIRVAEVGRKPTDFLIIGRF